MCRVYYESIRISTTKQFELIDITDNVEKIVRKSGIKNGICLVFAPHATAAIVANEKEHGLMSDIITFVKELVKPEREWRHNIIDSNAHAHIGSSVIGADRVFPVVNGELVRGTWQNIFLVEMDGPRSSRNIIVVVIGE
ncbi:secondary thiamine-phosphate synthase enzyme YjbQ [Ignisphaera sp. 4213-co]|uniref:Secondary thiamine-phosphate synthase enzyme YjbQ n=1 Tax=Ignisphaera cupida TaxID=3050454 RepID=A0ABD4ZBM2_9CREN|nr:secondary thiamine-phosphate synthase enzyme YjbQ [Ignisphaera sp. 4213-co]MDK6029483.1 secondary thiamine-phosphate synthase enzyme YjbQ [Ignisphaera sp. 4213-co]